MPFASASFLKLASQASKLPVFWQFACAKPRQDRRHKGESASHPSDRHALPSSLLNAACPCNDNSPILTKRFA